MTADERTRTLWLPTDVPLQTSAEAARRAHAGFHYVAGVRGAGAAFLSAEIAKQSRVLMVVPNREVHAKAALDLQYFLGGERCLALTASETNPYASTQPDRRSAMSRTATLAELSRGDWRVLVADAEALYRKVLPRAAIERGTRMIEQEQVVDLVDLAAHLTATGYLRAPVVEDPGSFAVRGGLLDVWSPEAPRPVRIELFGDEVLNLKAFDPETQRTAAPLSRVLLPPAREVLLFEEYEQRAREQLRELCDSVNYPSAKARQLIEELLSARQSFGISGYLPAFYELSTIWDYVPADCRVVIERPEEVFAVLRARQEAVLQAEGTPTERPRYPLTEHYCTEAQLEAELLKRAVSLCSPAFVQGEANTVLEKLELAPADVPTLGQSDHSELERAIQAGRTASNKQGPLDPLLERLAAWRDAGLRVTVVGRANTQAARLAQLLRHREVSVVFEDGSPQDTPDDSHHGPPQPRPDFDPSELRVRIEVGSLSRGFVALTDGQVWLTEEEIFGQRAHRTSKSKKASRSALENLRALAEGDYVVHTEHGIGRYLGLQSGTGPGGAQLELLVIEYSGGKLFLPVYRLNQVEKYSGGDKPKVDRLGGSTFTKSKAKARRKAREMADELLRLYAERKNAERPPLPKADDDYAAFEAAFPYEETPDQAAAILDVLGDLERDQVMDRLVCGDVGFGKTEVALRAAFRAVSAGRQVAVLCPTTVLAQQHFLTFQRRLGDSPFEVRALSRFQSKKEATDTLSRLRQGSVDIVIGTHRLLSKDLQFKNLGLVVIDEEQRFGVTHKERLKQMRASVDVLTLTATPIPRTLQFALGGLREMSIISTPPVDRRAIRTIVSRFDENTIKEAIERELGRGGQVFYVYNRVRELYERAARLQALLPNARIAVGHGQMNEATLEQVMVDFVGGQYDILVATSIIESGLDIPRANTMIVDRADLFGLAQLYQLRGRVGRSEERAYCYLMVPPPSEMTDEARSRIEALERYTELGSGFQIATLDMELRGAGDILGAEQSGPLASVGLEMFCQMLEEATRELRGEPPSDDIDPEMNFDCEALLPNGYIVEVGVRLSFYKRLASASDEPEVMHLASEMEDRFGPAPAEVLRLVELMRIKTELRRLKVLVCEATPGAVSLRFRDDTPIDRPGLVQMVATQKAKFRLAPDGRLTRKLREGERVDGSLGLADKLLSELAPLLRAG
ncbi:MAG: hypothetical protein RJA70_2410 [Pseudomonadota bacterium]|jgi:transcription-repair coupling factor (superfamily II helicase)